MADYRKQKENNCNGKKFTLHNNSRTLRQQRQQQKSPLKGMQRWLGLFSSIKCSLRAAVSQSRRAGYLHVVVSDRCKCVVFQAPLTRFHTRVSSVWRETGRPLLGKHNKAQVKCGTEVMGGGAWNASSSVYLSTLWVRQT